MEHIIGPKQPRQSAGTYIDHARHGQRFIVPRRSKAFSKKVPVNEADAGWEEVVDFTKVKRGGVRMEDVLARL